jgi:hypothetical protein
MRRTTKHALLVLCLGLCVSLSHAAQTPASATVKAKSKSMNKTGVKKIAPAAAKKKAATPKVKKAPASPGAKGGGAVAGGSAASGTKAPQVAESWKLTFISEKPTSPDPADIVDPNATPSDPINASTVSTFLGKVFGTSFTATPLGSNQLEIIGSEAQVAAAKNLLLTSIDVPFPQVRVRVWTIQLNELKNRAADQVRRMDLIQRGIAEAKLIESALTEDIGDWAMSQPPKSGAIPAFPFARAKADYETLTEQGGSPALWSRSYAPLRLALVDPSSRNKLGDVMSILDDPTADQHHTLKAFDILDQTDRSAGPKDTNFQKGLSKRDAGDLERLRELELTGTEVAQLHQLRLLIKDQIRKAVFDRYQSESKRHEPASISLLLNKLQGNWTSLQAGSTTPHLADHTLALEYDANKLFTDLNQAWADDLADLVYKPLTIWSEDIIDNGPNGSNGVDASGTSAIAVTSGQPATLVASMQESRSYNPPTQMTNNNITDLLGLAGHSAIAPGSELINLLAQPPAPVYLSLAGGVSVGLIPTVLPDATEARIHILLASTVNTGSGAASASNPVPDAINKLSAGTDVRVAADDLFELTSINSQNTALGDFSWQIPVLDEIPLIGPMFRGPRRHDTKTHKAMVLVTVGIIPDVISMLQSYCPSKVTIPAAGN